MLITKEWSFGVSDLPCVISVGYYQRVGTMKTKIMAIKKPKQ